jgi:hypothetical protein
MKERHDESKNTAAVVRRKETAVNFILMLPEYIFMLLWKHFSVR